MDKPKVFISSTIYDFSDLRSSLKYWLLEMGFDAQLSEFNDFSKDSSTNSYDACLKSIAECDYFVLLIGSRRGGMYPAEDISITRKEYRTAYDLALSGKIKKLVVFVRQNIWDVREDRKSLHQALVTHNFLDTEQKAISKEIEFHNSPILKDAEHILSFIDEVTRKGEARAGKKPVINWVHTFSNFEDIIDALKVELSIKVSMSVQVAEQSIRYALLRNLRYISYKADSGQIAAYFIPFKKLRYQLKEFRDKNAPNLFGKRISFPLDMLAPVSDYLLFFREGISDLCTYEFENIVSSGVFLNYNSEKCVYEPTPLIKALNQLVHEIHRLQRYEQNFPSETQERILGKYKMARDQKADKVEFDFVDFAMLSSIYERLENIKNLTQYILIYFDTHNSNIRFPEILDGLVESENPTIEDLQAYFTQE